MKNDVISAEQLIKYYSDVKALANITFSVRQGEIFGIVGPDGAGKTTLIRLLTGVLQQYEGSITVLGENRLERIKSRIGYMPQKFSLYQNMSVLENLQLIAALYDLKADVAAQRIEKILQFVDLWGFKDRFAVELSGGMKQKLALAAAVLHEPELVLLDEPGTGVDPVARREFWQLLYDFNQKGITVVVATPYMEEAELCHRILFLQQGRNLVCKAPKEIIADYPYKVLSLKSSSRDIPELLQNCYLLELESFSDTYHIVTDDLEKTAADITDALNIKAQGILKLAEPSLEDAFILLSEGESFHGSSN